MPFRIKFHGALGEVTGSCAFLKHLKSSTLYAIDCGTAHRRRERDEPAHPVNLPEGCRLESIKALFITHAHADHIGMFIHWIKAGFMGRIYCTRETAMFARFACQDSYRIGKRDGSLAELEERDLNEALRALDERCVHCSPGEVLALENGLDVRCFPTSHIMGCVGFQFSASDSHGVIRRVFFTGDVGGVEDDAETGSMMRARVRPPEASDYVITESTYGARVRGQDARSGLRRVARMSEVLERALRHGSKSVVIFPCFSLQRSQDVLMDLFLVLNYNRAATGLADGVVPRIYLDSPLASAFMGIFRDAYVGALAEEGSPWVNRSALFFEQLRIHGGDAEGILRRLFNFETKERIVAGRNVFEVINGPFRPESGRVFSSSTNQEDGSPAIVICGSGMTTHGAFQRYLRNHYGDSFATVVISGYVPSGSPGALLGEVANVAGNEQGRAGITLKIKATKQDPELVLSGSDVKSAYDSVADLYSGHADGASICRYVLKDKECAGRLRRVFLVHGEDHSRNGLKGMFEDEMASLVPSANSGASVECPRSDSPWFDCEKDEWEAQAPLKTSQSVLVPTSCSPDEILGLVRSAFLPHELAEGGLNLKFRASSSKISLRVKAFNAESHKLIVDTVYNGLSDLLEAGRVSFRWREVLNILGLQKAEHFAGHKLCTCEEEFQEFEAVRRPLVHGGKQRLNGFVLAGREAFQPEEMSALELLLTPHVPVFVLDNNYLSRINAALFSSAREKMSKKAAFYVPIQLGQPFIPISRPFDGLCLRALLSRVSDDAKIKDERLPASPISAASGSLAVAAPGFDKSRKGVPKDRLDVPSSDYERLIKGVPITAKVESRFANGKGYKLRVEGSRALGVIYEGSLVSEAPLTIGEIREVCLVELDAKNKKAVFVLARQRNRNREADIESILANPTYGTLAGLFGIPFRHFMDLLGDYCKDVLLDEQKVAQDDKIQEDPVLIYDRFAGGLDHDNAIRSSAPRHEPFTFAKMAGVLGEHWTYEGVLRALEIFKTSEQSELREITDIILRASSEGGPDRVFPLEQKDLFYAACVEFSNNGWKGDPAIKSEPPARQLPAPSYYTVQELSESWSCSSGHLLAEAVKLDLPIRAEVVVSVHDAQKLSASKTQEPSQ